MLQLQGQTLAPAISQLHEHLAHMGRPGRQLNQQTGFSWMVKGMSEMLTAWLLPQIALEHSSKPYCRLLAPHLHSYKTVFARSRQVQTCHHHLTSEGLVFICTLGS